MLSREKINELNFLSKAVFGTTSKWRKMCDMGVTEPVMEDTKRMVIRDGKEVYEMIKTQKSDDNGLLLSRLNHYTPETVKDFMLTVLNRRQEIQNTINRLEAEKKAEAAAKQTAAAASGTAV